MKFLDRSPHPIERFSIRGRAVFVATVTTCTALVLTCATLSIYEWATFQNKIQSELKALAATATANCAIALGHQDRELAASILSGLGAKKTILVARLTDSEARVFATYVRPGTHDADSNFEPELDRTFVGRYVDVAQPVYSNGRRLGTLVVRAGTSELWGRVISYVSVVILIGLMAAYVSYRILASIKRIATEPLTRLAIATGVIAVNQDYSIRLPEDRSDEIGFLIRGFNEMLELIEARDQRLLRHSRDLEEAKEAALAADSAKTIFLANMSHEIRTPLHGVLSFAKFGIRKMEAEANPKTRDYFEKIHQSASQLLTIVNDLLDLSKLEAGRMRLTLIPRNLMDLVRTVVDETAALIDEKRLQVSIQCESDFKVPVDLERMGQVIRNLLNNSIKFSPSGSVIEISLQRRGNCGLLIVRDEGVGIPEEDLEKVFNKFEQSAKTGDGSGGTGLGLAICREIVTRHNGRIWADNNADRGVSLLVELPLANEAKLVEGAIA